MPCVLPYDPQRDEVVLIEQFRVGAMGRTDNPWLVEMVAGLIDKDEQPEEVAHREAEEEAGLTFSALWPITKYFLAGWQHRIRPPVFGALRQCRCRRYPWPGRGGRRYPCHRLGF